MLLLLLLVYYIFIFIYLFFFSFFLSFLSPLSPFFSSFFPLHLLPLPIGFYTSKSLPIHPSNFSLLIFFIIFLHFSYTYSSWLPSSRETHYMTHTPDGQPIFFLLLLSLLSLPTNSTPNTYTQPTPIFSSIFHSQHLHTAGPYFLFHFFSLFFLPTHNNIILLFSQKPINPHYHR